MKKKVSFNDEVQIKYFDKNEILVKKKKLKK